MYTFIVYFRRKDPSAFKPFRVALAEFDVIITTRPCTWFWVFVVVVLQTGQSCCYFYSVIVSLVCVVSVFYTVLNCSRVASCFVCSLSVLVISLGNSSLHTKIRFATLNLY